MPEVTFSIATVEAVLGFVLSLLLEKIPWLKEHWTNVSDKALILFVGFVSVTVGWWALGCWSGVGFLSTGLPCDPSGLAQAIVIGALGFAGTQTGWGVVSRYTENAVARSAE